jgi:hypothetical protein
MGLNTLEESMFGRRGICWRHALVVMACISLGSLYASAQTQTSTWTDTAGDSSWTNPANWSPSGIPNNKTNGFTDYNVFIGSPAPTNLSAQITVDSITINSEAELNVESGVLTVDQSLTNVGGQITTSGVPQNSAAIYFNNIAVQNISGGQMTAGPGGFIGFGNSMVDNSGGEILANGGTAFFGFRSVINNAGGQILSSSQGGNGGIAIGGTVIGGTVGGSNISAAGIAYPSVFENVTFTSGTAVDMAQGTLTLEGLTTLEGGLTFSGDGIIQGVGTIQGAFSGRINVGDPLGQLNITGDYQQGDSYSPLTMALGGSPASGNFSSLTVGGAATLGGPLHLSFINGFRPTIGQTYTFLTAGSISGQFNAVQSAYPVDIHYGPTSISLTILPEPASLFLLSAAVLLSLRRPPNESTCKIAEKKIC